MVLSNLEKNKLGPLQAIDHAYWYDGKRPFEKAPNKDVKALTTFFDICDKIEYKELDKYRMFGAINR